MSGLVKYISGLTKRKFFWTKIFSNASFLNRMTMVQYFSQIWLYWRERHPSLFGLFQKTFKTIPKIFQKPVFKSMLLWADLEIWLFLYSSFHKTFAIITLKFTQKETVPLT
jgi:hypothetical protein